MCGILLVACPVLSHHQDALCAVNKHAAAFEPALRSRGPDQFSARQVTVPGTTASTAIPDCRINTQTRSAGSISTAEVGNCNGSCDDPKLLLHLAASLLQLRGTTPSTSPLSDTQGNVLCFNGEVFAGLGMASDSNDGKALLAALAACDAPQQVVSVLSRLRGPWSLIYWQMKTNLLWFARDWLGRRSLLLKHHQHHMDSSSSNSNQPCMVLASVAPSQHQQQHQQLSELQESAAHAAANGALVEPGAIHVTKAASSSSRRSSHYGSWIEVPPGIYSISSNDLYNTMADSSSSSSGASIHLADEHGDLDTPANSGVLAPADLCIRIQGLQHYQFDDQQIQQLQHYDRQQQLIQPDAAAPAVLQAGGDQQQQQSGHASENGVSTALQEAAQQVLKLLQASVDVRCLTINKLQQQQQQHTPNSSSTESLAAVSQSCCQAPAAAAGAGPATGCCHTSDVQQQQRQQQQQKPRAPTGAPLQDQAPNRHLPLAPAPVLVLFSGGVDSTLIAALAHLALPPEVPIDLSNVCFVQGQSPDRQAAHSALLELAAFAPNRQWRLIEVDSDLAEVDRYADHIRSLLHPAGTVMDLNIGAALWLAARAEGNRVLVPVRDTAAASEAAGLAGHDGSKQQWKLVPVALSNAQSTDSSSSSNSSSRSSSMYRSAARVVLLGHGADEQCGGYGRHRTKFRFNGGWQALADELALDVKRLWIRNLGRDDRLIADHGREGRHPFLDEQLMTALLNMPLPVIADLNKPIGVGDKQVLRQALANLGITVAAGREKRAIQFGSRIGKLSNQREFGSNRKANMLSAGQLKLDTLQQHNRQMG